MSVLNQPRVWNEIFVIGEVRFYKWIEPLTEWHKYISVDEYERRYVLQPPKRKIAENFHKKVYQYSVEGEYIRTYKSIDSAAKAFYVSRTGLWNYLVRRDKTVFRGYIFSLVKLYDHE